MGTPADFHVPGTEFTVSGHELRSFPQGCVATVGNRFGRDAAQSVADYALEWHRSRLPECGAPEAWAKFRLLEKAMASLVQSAGRTFWFPRQPTISIS